MMTHRERLRDQSGFIHRSAIGRFVGGAISTVVSGVPLVGGVASSLFDRIRGEGGVPGTEQGCPPGFVNTAQGCQPRGTIPFEPRGTGLGGAFRRVRDARRLPPPQTTNGSLAAPPVPGLADQGQFPQPTLAQTELRTRLGRAVDPAAGVPVMGRFGAGFEPSVFMTDTRRCGRGAVLGVDGICYNRRDLRNSERFWPRGRRPLLTGGEVRAISVASSAAKKLERKQKQLRELGLLKPATRSRRAAPAGHKVTLSHDGGSQH